MERNTLRPFYFTVVFWGEVYRRYFLDLLLASLLSPNNIPALDPDRKSKFLIVTTQADWDALQSEPLFQEMRRYVEPIWFEMTPPGPKDHKMRVMSQGHKIATTYAFNHKAYGMYVTPDVIISDGSVKLLQTFAEQGWKVVLVAAFRFQYETIVRVLEAEGYLQPNRALSISPRELMRIALPNLHSETRRYEFEAPYYADQPVSPYWCVPGSSDIIMHSFQWAPLLVDYAGALAHDTATFEKWTMDGDYIWRNFPDSEHVHVVTDSDDIAYVSLTKEEDLHFDLAAQPHPFPHEVFHHFKIHRIRSFMYSRRIDALKRAVFRTPVIFHEGPISAAHRATIERAGLVVACGSNRWDFGSRLRADLFEQYNAGLVARRIGHKLMASAPQLWEQVWKKNRFYQWLFIYIPWWWLVRIAQHILRRLSPAIWLYRYRRFVWWRLMEKMGVVKERYFDWESGGWDVPAVSLVCPIYTIRWIWRHRDTLKKEFKSGGAGIRGRC